MALLDGEEISDDFFFKMKFKPRLVLFFDSAIKQMIPCPLGLCTVWGKGFASSENQEESTHMAVQDSNILWLSWFFWGRPTQTTEKAMAPHSSTLAWKIPWAEEPGRLQSMGSLRVGHNWAASLSLFTFLHWRMKWQPTPLFLPRESQGCGSLVGCRLWGRTESDTTEAT